MAQHRRSPTPAHQKVTLLEQVVEGKVPNERAELLALAREYRAEK